MITGLAHINLVVPEGTLDKARAFYSGTLGLVETPVPALQRDTLAWINLGDSGQQIHVSFGGADDFAGMAARSRRHPCFRIAGGPEALLAVQHRIWQHFRGGDGVPSECDAPGNENSGESGVALLLDIPRADIQGPWLIVAQRVDCAGAKGVEYPERFFARDYAGNRLEFSL